MLKFSEFILEYLTPEQEKTWSKVKIDPVAKARTDHFFGPDNDHVQEDIKDYEHDKSEIHKKVESHLGKELSHEEYKSGLTNDKYGRPTKIGKLIKDDKLKTEYSNDSTRVGAKVKQPYMTIVRGHHVAGQTNPEPDALHPTGHAWENESCKNINTGSNRRYLKNEIEHGSVVVRGHDADGKEIYRATLHPHYHHTDGDHLYALNSEYGIKHPAFTAHAHDVAERLSGPFKSGPYHIDIAVYNDKYTSIALHPGATPEHLTKMLDDSDATSKYNTDAYEHVLSSNKATPEHIQRGLEHDSVDVRSMAARHKNATPEQITKGLNDESRWVRSSAADNPRLNQDHIKHILTHENDWTIAQKVGIKAKGENIDLALNHRMGDVRNKTIRSNPNITADHLTSVLKGNGDLYETKGYALKHSKINPSHIDLALDDKDDFIASQAAKHPAASDDNISKAISKSSWGIASDALDNPNVKPHHIDQALAHPNSWVRATAAAHSLLNPKKLPKLIGDPNEAVASSAVRNKNINDSHKEQILSHPNPVIRAMGFQSKNLNPTSEELHKGLSDEDDEVRNSAIRHLNITPEHINKAMDDPNETIRLHAIRHENVDSGNIDKMFNIKDTATRRSALNYNIRKMDDSHIDKMISDPYTRDLATNHDGLKPRHITKLLKTLTKDSDIRSLIRSNDNLFTPEHINTVLTNPKFGEKHKEGVLFSKNTSSENYMTALHPDQHLNVKKYAWSNLLNRSKLTPAHVTEALKSPETIMRYSAAPHASAEELPALLHKDEQPVVREEALKNKHVTSEHLSNILNEPYNQDHHEVYERAVEHEKLQPNHIQQLLTRPYKSHVLRAMHHPTAVTPGVIDMALNYNNAAVAGAAIKHENASAENLHRAVLHPHQHVANAALNNPNIRREHLLIAASHHPDPMVKNYAKVKLDKGST